MKFPKLAKIIREEVQGKPFEKYLDKFLPTFNFLLDSTSNTLTNNVSLRDNAAGQFVELKGVKGSKLKALEINWTRKDQPLMISLCYLRLVSSSSTDVANAGTIGMSSIWNVGTNIPETHMEEDGRALKKALYPELYAVIGDSFNTQTNPTTGGLWAAPASDEFRIPDNRGLHKRGAGNSYRMVSSAGTKLVSISVGMVMDDATAKNGLSASAAASSITSGSAASAGAHTHTVSVSGTTDSAGAHQHGFSVKSGAANNGSSGVKGTLEANDVGSQFTASGGAHTHTVSSSGSSASAGAHTHTVTGNAAAQTITVGAGDTETSVRSRGVLWIIQVKPIGSSSVPIVDPRWGFDGSKISCALSGVADSSEYNVSLWIQA